MEKDNPREHKQEFIGALNCQEQNGVVGPQNLQLLIWWKSLPEASEVGTSLGCVRIEKGRKARGPERRGEGSMAGGVPDGMRGVRGGGTQLTSGIQGSGGTGEARATVMIKALGEYARLGERHLGNFAGESQPARRNTAQVLSARSAGPARVGVGAQEEDGFKEQGGVGLIRVHRGHMERAWDQTGCGKSFSGGGTVVRAAVRGKKRGGCGSDECRRTLKGKGSK